MPDTSMPTGHSVAGVRRKLLAWFAEHGRHDLPWRRSYDAYQVLVSEFMLQQTQVSRVIAFFEAWLKAFPDIAALSAASDDQVMRAWQGLGYYRRAKSLHTLAKVVVQDHGGTLPDDPTLLKDLPGIGPYTIGALQCFARDQVGLPLDTNLRRVLSRIFGLDGQDQALLEAVLLKFLNKTSPRQAASALMDFGAMVCSARTPSCSTCPLASNCVALAKGTLSLDEEPKRTPRKRAPQAIGILRDGNQALTCNGELFLLADTRSVGPREALKESAVKRYGIEIAVRPECGRISMRGVETSLHRCSVLFDHGTNIEAATKATKKGQEILLNAKLHLASKT